MKKLILIVLTGVWIPALASDAEDAEAKLYEYFEVFNQKDAEKVANVIYSTPVHIGGGTAHRVLATPEAVAQLQALSGEFQVRKTLTPSQWDPRFQDLDGRLSTSYQRYRDRPLSWVELVDARPPLRVMTAWKWAPDSPVGDEQVLASYRIGRSPLMPDQLPTT